MYCICRHSDILPQQLQRNRKRNALWGIFQCLWYCPSHLNTATDTPTVTARQGRREEVFESRQISVGLQRSQLVCGSICPLILTTMAEKNVHKTITSYIGHTTILPCLAPSNTPISAVEWTRREQSQYVFLHRDGHSDTEDQDPSFENRVELRDRQLKEGDLSLILKKVNPSDAGIYECRHKNSRTRCRKRSLIDSDPISIVELRVDPAPRNTMIGALEWTNQHPSFENPVELQEDKDGDPFLVRMNVSIHEARLQRRAMIKSEPNSIIEWNVTDSGHTAGNTRTKRGKDGGESHVHYGSVAIALFFIVLLLSYLVQ
ncbi:uncharacterized protein LOC122974180 isoform X1 [Thunnus albacares]|uniref:uncharacterized protein LOC122974180 isoform X1 n=2 Tax=Thunnus albacares TaxID=8236 RepID=UPI001CF67B01|nr:uncharacterized protein LOC122974180 isoform X1 [Thunnus albacares]